MSSRHFEGIHTLSSDESEDLQDAISKDLIDAASLEATDPAMVDSGMGESLVSAGTGLVYRLAI